MNKLASYEFARFFSVSIANLVIDLLFITLMVELFRVPDRFTDSLYLFSSVTQGEFLSRVIAFSLTFFIAFFLQSKFTFRQKTFQATQLKKYFIVTASLTALQLLTFPFFLHVMKSLFSQSDPAPLHLYYVSVVMAGSVALILSFLLNKVWTFKPAT